MPRGSSGRIVIEIDPETKDELYAALAREDRTLKDWFLERAKQYLYEDVQLGFDFVKTVQNGRGN